MANNLQISNVSVVSTGPPTVSALVTFNISWENSWRVSGIPNNWDAAWVFIKYRVNGGPWQHATLSGTGNTPATATVDIKDGVGAMIYRAQNGTGTFELFDVELLWDFAADGVDPNDNIETEVYGIEMVYVPEGAFEVGNNKLGNQDLETRTFSSANDASYSVTSAGQITNGNSQLQWSNSGATRGNIPAAYPEGFSAFYCMKYEVSQEGWVAFFNTLTPQQKTTRDVTASNGKNSDAVVNRNGVSWSGGSADATTSLPFIPMGWQSRNDGLAYLDWAGLRPMTELEYEKACRGPIGAEPNQFAWATTDIERGQHYQITNAGQANEEVTTGTLSTTAGNAVHGDAVDNPNAYTNPDGATHLDGNPGPLRSGIFAASLASPTRETSGATYYGIMEMSGNLAEGCISVTTSQARNYTGDHGDGTLVANGNHNVGWPTEEGSIGFRGSWFDGDISYAMMADRSLMGTSPNTDVQNNHDWSNSYTERLDYYQIRGVRSE